MRGAVLRQAIKSVNGVRSLRADTAKQGLGMGLMGQQTLSILIPAQRAGISKGLDKRALGDPRVSAFPPAEVPARLHHVTVLNACWLLKGHAGRAQSDREFVLATRRGTPREGVLGPTTRKRSSSMTTPSPESNTTETRVLTDRFVTLIQALDLTPGPLRGRIVTIQ